MCVCMCINKYAPPIEIGLTELNHIFVRIIGSHDARRGSSGKQLQRGPQALEDHCASTGTWGTESGPALVGVPHAGTGGDSVSARIALGV